jgi:predicted ATPase
LLVLGYLALLLSPHPPRLLLIEEPENGIHPKRLQDVLGILGELASAQSLTQILLTTHSPYAVDSFKPEQVTLCTKSDDGTVELTRMSASKAVREQESLFTLGEIWTAEGDNELARGQTVSSP